MYSIELNLVNGEFGLEAKDADSHIVQIDNSPDHGGKNFGVRPMQLLLMALAGCSAMDVLSILRKQKQSVTSYKMIVKGEREQNKTPALWEKIFIEFYLAGTVDPDKARRAAELSIEKYCSVSATLEKAGAHIEWQIFINDEKSQTNS